MAAMKGATELQKNFAASNQAITSTQIIDDRSCEYYSNTQSTTVVRSKIQRREPDGTWGQGVNDTSSRYPVNNVETKTPDSTEMDLFRNESDVLNSQANTSSGSIEEALSQNPPCPPLNVFESEDENEFRANDIECGQAVNVTMNSNDVNKTERKNTVKTETDIFRESDSLNNRDENNRTNDDNTETKLTAPLPERDNDDNTETKLTAPLREQENDDNTETKLTVPLLERENDDNTETKLTVPLLERENDDNTETKLTAPLPERENDDNTETKLTAPLLERENDDNTETKLTAPLPVRENDGNTETKLTAPLLERENDDNTETKLTPLPERENANRAITPVSRINGAHSVSTDARIRTSNDDDETVLQVQLPEEDIVDRSIPISCAIDTHSECVSSRSKMESRNAQRFFDLEQAFSDELQTNRQQLRFEFEQNITYSRIGRLQDYKGHEFGAIYRAMPDARRRFTVQLVQKYAWFKEEMTETVARNVAQTCLSKRHLEYLHLNCNTRPQYVGHFLKMVLRCGKQQIENEFLNALQTEGTEGIRFANEVEQSFVTSEKMKAFEDLQRERNQYQISEDKLPNVCFDRFEVDLLNDHLFSRLFFSYKEHSVIEESNGKSSLFFETIRKCHENVLDDFKIICDANDIFIDENAQRDSFSETTTLPSSALSTNDSLSKSLEASGSACRQQDRPSTKDKSTITDVIIDESSTPPSLQSIGIETIHTHEGSLVMILKLTDEQSLANLKDKCADGSIGDVLIELLRSDNVQTRLNPGNYDFKMKLHASTEDARFVEMKIEGSVFDKKERMCIHRTGGESSVSSSVFDHLQGKHPRYICEELEISDSLLDILKTRNLVPHDLASKLLVHVNRRDKIHELLRHYDIDKDKGFSYLFEYIRTVRESRRKKAYPLKLFEGTFVTKYDGICLRIVHTGLRLTWTSSSFAGNLKGQSKTIPRAVHLVYCEDDFLRTRQLLKRFALSGLQCHATEMTRVRTESLYDLTVIVIPCSSYHDHWQDIGSFDVSYPFILSVIHEDESMDDEVDEWLNKNIAKPYKVHHLNLSEMDNQTLLGDLLDEHESSKEFKERSKTIIIRHLKGSFEYENKIYTEVVKHDLGCRIVSEFSDRKFANTETVPCVVIHKGVDLNEERLRHYTEEVWQVLLIGIDNNAMEHVHTMMTGLQYRMHDINHENVRWPQEVLQQLTGIRITEDGTAYAVRIVFDIRMVKYANMLYKGLDSIGIRCVYDQKTFHMYGLYDSCVCLQTVPSKSMEAEFSFLDKVHKEQLYVLVTDSSSELMVPPGAQTIPISLQDTKWPYKVKARLEGFQPLEEPGYQEWPSIPLLDLPEHPWGRISSTTSKQNLTAPQDLAAEGSTAVTDWSPEIKRRKIINVEDLID